LECNLYHSSVMTRKPNVGCCSWETWGFHGNDDSMKIYIGVFWVVKLCVRFGC
jgi:hypothetical protein